ncbi:helix-turn-helix transcriptional regulator [Streptosporangium sp. NPDC002721]|uniref:helix-turn-helix transcriptional regulator n=1 Tax=Streptosporangium sp. NPDC002721 TaxID=3366188 RepID=UPI0036CB9C84
MAESRKPRGTGDVAGGDVAGGAPSARAAERLAPPPAGRRRLVLTMLRESGGPLGVIEIAERLDVHPNTVRFHLDALVDAGQIERVHAAPAGPGRPPLVFRARPGMDLAGPRNYRVLAEILAGSLATGPDPAARATEAGRAWGDALAAGRPAPEAAPTREEAVRELVGLLDDIGFAPEERSAGGDEQTGQPGQTGQIGLRHCPFLELVKTQGKVICPLHLGLMQGTMSALGSPVTVDRLEPFAEPDLCLAHLAAVRKEP